MSDSKVNMHQIVCRLGLRPRPRWGSLQRSPGPSSWILGGLLLRGEGRDEREWEGTQGRGGEREGEEGKGGEERGKGRRGMGRDEAGSVPQAKAENHEHSQYKSIKEACYSTSRCSNVKS